MPLLTLAAFAFLFWQAEEPGRWAVVAKGHHVATLLIVFGQPVLWAGIAKLAIGRLRARLGRFPGRVQQAYSFYHRLFLGLRLWTLVGFAGSVFLTPWPQWCHLGRFHPALQVFGDWLVLAPFFASLVALWAVAYPFEQSVFRSDGDGEPGDDSPHAWTFRSYLDFHVRHDVLVVAVPMTIILFAANMTRAYERDLTRWFGRAEAPDAMLGVVAALVFLLAPMMLRRVWRTHPLEAGPLRDRLESTCRRIGFRCREILVWDSHGMMVNAAVMGIAAPVRYILLSDALLKAMDADQIEAVFGHEAGHVKHRHIQHFLVFAYAGWLVSAGLMELGARCSRGVLGARWGSSSTAEWIAVGLTGVVWLLVFGWLSRRFERQADVFGARCVTPEGARCTKPCSVHFEDGSTSSSADRVCMTGASRYTSALDRVALLNGIPAEEYSWRHSSIGSRIRFLISLAGDPHRAVCFQRSIRRTTRAMMVLAIVGSCVALYLGWSHLGWGVAPSPTP